MPCPPIASYPCDAPCAHPWLHSNPPYGFFFCFQGLTLINRAEATLLTHVASTAPGSCGRHACPAREASRRSQRATAMEPMLSAAKLRSSTTAVWDHCAAGAYPAGQCFGDWHRMFPWPTSLLCLVTMPFCLLELGEDWVTVVNFGKAELWSTEKCVFPDLCATKSNVVRPVLLLTYAWYLLNFHDQDSKYKDVGLLW